MEKDLFLEDTTQQASKEFPLAYRMRPRNLDEFAGQRHLLGAGKLLRRIIAADRVTSLVFYGPPGTGKTTLAWIISKMTRAVFKSVSGVGSTVQELRKILDEAVHRRTYQGQKTILFVDEIHRFNKAQQDVLMPEVESGAIVMIGATTHNPFFSINGPLLSRSMVLELNPLAESEILEVLHRALTDKERGFGNLKVEISEEARHHIARNTGGDARRALNALELGVLSTAPNDAGAIVFDKEVAEESLQKKMVYYDRDEDTHYDTASALIKSLRGSDPDAAVYWLAKMLYAGEESRFICRRLTIFASEDVGNADPQALVVATNATQAVEFVGMPEGRIVLAQLVTYLALAPKSNASFMALEEARKDIEKKAVEEVPQHLRDASYPGAKRLNRGQGYEYPHDFPEHFVKQEYIAHNRTYYRPTAFGYEKILKERLEKLRDGA